VKRMGFETPNGESIDSASKRLLDVAPGQSRGAWLWPDPPSLSGCVLQQTLQFTLRTLTHLCANEIGKTYQIADSGAIYAPLHTSAQRGRVPLPVLKRACFLFWK